MSPLKVNRKNLESALLIGTSKDFVSRPTLILRVASL